MLDIKFIENNADAVRKAIKDKGFGLDLDELLQVNVERKALITELEEKRAKRNELSKSIGKAKAAGEDITPLVAEVGQLGDALDAASEQLTAVQQSWDDLVQGLPNLSM